ncbi:Glucosidase 2 subunit beta [Taphrina deformans PYCC 5710]|uniref:Glucosidase 2 subunit beta n=1 Tax=Taphrina deformans (strain PYCC 5710 / ATCC 11124 / CBS 356.35 / IMI 108563 / JCM 9778 / NBRC 8474) TaxID=1097556 RepID=R4XDF7_TAPDE|nr:Glucosidase 2 subunit beta [Taphrina deformans PYCC 5710]|eukprot:CCG81379.1 Glucosidase 2 subunit beta [Taphrina deformans PYCC 5710]
MTFFCQNAGHIPVHLPSNRVNDGVCEESCCDGSDEWLGLAECPNTCREKAKAHAASEAKKEAIRASGWKVRQEWEKKAHKLRAEVEDELQRTEAKLESFKINLRDKESALSKLESESRQAGPVSTGQEEVDQIMTRFKETINDLKNHIDMQQQRIAEFETIMRALAEGYNPNFQDMSVKGAVTSFNSLVPLSDSNDVEQTIQDLLEVNIEVAKARPSSKSDAGVYGLWEKTRTKLVDIGLIQRASFDPADFFESKQYINMKASTEGLREEIVQLEREVNKLKTSLEQNLGPRDILRAVRGQCFSALISDYTYEICLLETLHQKSPSMSTLVGTFDHVDENGSLVYSHGQKCWNGPERSGRVDMECGSQNELLAVREAQKCEYVFRIKTPLACGPPIADGTGREEL